jgi:hypothetical protein
LTCDVTSKSVCLGCWASIVASSKREIIDVNKCGKNWQKANTAGNTDESKLM